ncbi:MAG: lipoyl(octanoyl) transferase LipB [Planctomycetota bacterium]
MEVSPTPLPTAHEPPALEAFLLGRIGFDVCLELQRRLIPQVAERDDGQVTLLLCEHPTVVTIGRGGSPAHVARESYLIRNRQIPVTWVNRGGGCLMHAVGQLAIYPLLPLRWHGLRPGVFLERLQTALIESLDELNVPSEPRAGRFGVWGRTGQLAALGVAVRNWVTYYGAYLNVTPPMGLFRLVESDPKERTAMSCLVTERRGPVRMPTVRAVLVRRLAEAFGCDRYHLYTGHPMLRRG